MAEEKPVLDPTLPTRPSAEQSPSPSSKGSPA